MTGHVYLGLFGYYLVRRSLFVYISVTTQFVNKSACHSIQDISQTGCLLERECMEGLDPNNFGWRKHNIWHYSTMSGNNEVILSVRWVEEVQTHVAGVTFTGFRVTETGVVET